MTYLIGISRAAEDVKIKILAINPSETQTLNTEVSHILPPEVSPEDIVDKAGMSIRYSQDHKSYQIFQAVELAPKEAKTIVIRVKNVWTVPDEVLGELKTELEKNVTSLQGTQYEETSQMFYDKVLERITSIETEQVKAIGVKQRIEMYRAHMTIVSEIKKDLASLLSMRQIKNEQTNGVRTVKFVITAKNPASKDVTMDVRAMLPKGILGSDVVEKLGFELLYDEPQSRYLLQKQELFTAKETKKYEIILKDIWFIQESELELIRKQTDKIMQHFAQSAYEAFAKQMGDYIYDSLDSILKLQAEVASSDAIDERIRAFILNSERLELVKQKLKELQDLLLEIPLKRELDEFDKIRQAVKELSKVVDILRLGFTPDLSTTWWIILGVIAFLFVLTALFYSTWLVKLQESKWSVKKKKAVVPSASAVSATSTETPNQPNSKAA
ncbi:MAG: hypothetical protein HYZ84_02375 [Candidatus Omnitrophica bacterium]|nr:hypothetical protein [Candidatus Omnitrophota bacterium]